MKIKNLDSFGKEIKKYFDENGKKFLPDPTPLSIKNRMLTILKNSPNEEDYKIIISFLKLKPINSQNFISELQKLGIDKFKPIQNFLKGKSGLRFEESYNFTAWLIDFHNRPYSYYLEHNHDTIQSKKTEKEDENVKEGYIENINDSDNNIGFSDNSTHIDSKKTTVFNNSQLPFYVIVFVLAIIAVTSFYFFNQKGDTNINVGGVEINNDFRQIYPTAKTQFFDNNKQPIVWYASNNGEYRFFNQAENPSTQEIYRPITREVINTHFVNKIPQKENIPYTKTIYPTKAKEISNPKEEKLIPKKINSISVFILDSIGKTDSYFSSHIKQELRNKNYTIYNNKEVLTNPKNILLLKNGDIGNLNKDNIIKTDYIFIGNTKYSFSPNPVLQGKITCKMYIEYSIISTVTGEIINNFSNIISGYGSSNASAKNNTINKFSL
ncbi:protein of unknown function [Tenacibaculum sp. 190524A02b]|uniref:hypothetical protein n=1 Tax=Tenacibaculum vairaonense TaxID=3137860 RepID=UPI0032B1B977